MRPTTRLRSAGWALLPPAVSLLFLSAGCNPAFTRLPTLQTGPPQIERRFYESHDPFPLKEPGPDTQTRPPGFFDQRSEPRRLQQPPFPTPPPTGMSAPPPTSATRYGNVVR